MDIETKILIDTAINLEGAALALEDDQGGITFLDSKKVHLLRRGLVPDTWDKKTMREIFLQQKMCALNATSMPGDKDRPGGT